MSKKGFEITGVLELQDMLENIAPKHARNLMRATVQGVAQKVAKSAKEKAPKDRGDLKKAIKAKRKRSPPDAPVSDVRVEQGKGAKHDAFYWKFQEYGGKHHQEQPFIRPAKDEAQANINETMKEEFGKKLEAHLKREAKKNSK